MQSENMNSKYAPLFQPYTLNNGITIDNRLVVAPMTHLASNPDGSLSDGERAFLQERVRGYGMFITAATLVSAEGKAFPGQPEAVGDKDLPSLREVAAIIRSGGGKAILQIHHGGHQALKELIGDADKVAPSDHVETGARSMTDAEVRAVIASYGRATDLAIRAGFDGIEIHGANGYLIQQFYSAKTNRRQDDWGGSIEKRMRFPLAVVDAAVAEKVRHQRDDFIIGYRFSPEEPGDEGLTLVETLALVDALAQKPLQYLHISLWDFYKKVRRGADTSLTRLQVVHEHLAGRLPLIGVGNLFTAGQMLAAFETGWAEFIALGKTVMINPDLVTLMAEGRDAEILTELDPSREDYYRIPDRIWEMSLQGNMAWLPPVKGKPRQTIDV